MNSPNEPTEAQIDAVALALAESFWRGRLSAVFPEMDEWVRTAMLEAAAKQQVNLFRGSARFALSQ